MASIPGFWAVVPAGGAGTRLWPLSRAAHPKFLLDLTGTGRTLLQGTVDRLTPLTDERVLVVTGTAHADAVRAQLPGLLSDQVLAETVSFQVVKLTPGATARTSSGKPPRWPTMGTS